MTTAQFVILVVAIWLSMNAGFVAGAAWRAMFEDKIGKENGRG